MDSARTASVERASPPSFSSPHSTHSAPLHPPPCSTLQKRCYKVLYAVCQHHSEFALEESRLQELLELLTGSLLTCHVSSRQMRLRCLDCLVGAFDPSNESHMAAIPNIGK